MQHDMKACIDACLDCHRSCLATIAHCLGKGGHHAEADHILVMTDCAQICIVCADFLIRNSAHAAHLCGECAEICKLCETSCRTHGEKDQAMLQCADACKTCAEECARLAA